MTTEEFAAELQRDIEWRRGEVLQLKNLIASERDLDSQDSLRKSLVVVLYAHLEGFCVFALEHYLTAVNQARLTCREAVSAVLAGAWEPVFNAMEHGDQKCRIFRRSLPNDANLHRHWRRRHFVEQVEEFLDRIVTMPDDVIDVESNLKPQVLQRNLFLLGLDHTFVEPHADTINRLLKRRNKIAHGDQRRGVTEKEYAEYESAVNDICDRLTDFLENAHRNQHYRRPAPEFSV